MNKFNTMGTLMHCNRCTNDMFIFTGLKFIPEIGMRLQSRCWVKEHIGRVHYCSEHFF